MKGGPVAEPREQAAYNRLLRGVERIAGSVDLENEEDSFAAATHYAAAVAAGMQAASDSA